MQFYELYRKLKRNQADYGIWVTLRKSICYLFKAIYEHRVYRIYEIDLDKFKPKPFEQRGFDFKVLDDNYADIIEQIEDMEEWLKGKIKIKLEGGSLCLVALDKERVVGFNLVSFHKVAVPLLAQTKDLADDEAWSEQITIHKDYRGKGLGSELRLRVFDELKRRGIKRLFGGTLPNNIANLTLSKKVGFNELTDVHYTKLLHLKRWKYAEIKN